MRIWKYEVAVGLEHFIKIPKRAKILTFQNQSERATLWVEVDVSDPNIQMEMEAEFRNVQLVMTGQNSPNGAHYIGTAQFANGSFVLHAYDLGA